LNAPYLLPSGVLAVAGPPRANDRLAVGHVGVGGWGTVHQRNMLKFLTGGWARVAAVCDVGGKRLATAVRRAGLGVMPYRDYRYIFEHRDVDAVAIATPDYGHAVQTLHAGECGKHDYVEKPASVAVEEEKAVVSAARKNGWSATSKPTTYSASRSRIPITCIRCSSAAGSTVREVKLLSS
jgi:hypothetical protein